MVDKIAYSRNKLLHHLDRLASWVRDEPTPPIMVDFDLTNKCNNRCPRCCTQQKDDISVDFETAKEVILQFKNAGLRSIIFAGGGEPSCHPNLEQLLKFVKENGMDVGVHTNGYELSDSLVKSVVDYCTWIRISLDADCPETYRKTHGMGPEAFFQVAEKIKRIAARRNSVKSDLVVGTGYLLGRHTIGGIYSAARLVRDLGADNIRFRPFACNGVVEFNDHQIKEMQQQLEKAKGLETPNFSVSYPQDRCETMINGRKGDYNDCHVPHFIFSVSADLKLYSCCRLKHDDSHCFGDLKKQTFEEIWSSKNRQEVYDRININRDCPNPCMYEEHNEILHLIRRKILHPNFL